MSIGKEYLDDDNVVYEVKAENDSLMFVVEKGKDEEGYPEYNYENIQAIPKDEIDPFPVVKAVDYSAKG